MPLFDEAGNIITKKTDFGKLKKLEQEFEELTNGKEVYNCQYCNKGWDKELSNKQHERWCVKNPNPRKYSNKGTKVKKEKAEENPISGLKKRDHEKTMEKLKTKKETKVKSKPKDIIKELKKFDKVFSLTDEQIVKYIRNLMEIGE